MRARLSIAQALRSIGRPVFTTREIAAIRGGSVAATSQSLGRLEKEALLVRAARGVWCDPADPRFTPFSLIHFLAGGHPAYVSFLSALHLHGVIEQIPQVIYAATTAHTAMKDTAVGSYSFHRIDPQLFAGFDWYGERRDFLIATQEKALVDSLYLSSRKGRRFGHFPELDFGAGFSFEEADEWVQRIPSSRIRKFVAKQLGALRIGVAA